MQKSQYFYTIITSTYNCGSDFINTAESIKLQQRSDIQWIVVDGASKQSTIDIINSYKYLIHTFISEPDNGIYDAWNKATNYILGDWIIFLGAGDTFHSKQTLNDVGSKLVSAFPSYTLVYGKLDIYSPYNDSFIKTVGQDLSKMNTNESLRPNVPIHPETFQHKSLFDVMPVFDTTFKIVGDTDFLNRVYDVSKAKFIDIIITNIRGGGISQSLKYSLSVFNELIRIKKKRGIKIRPYLVIKNYIYFLAKYLLSFIISDNFFWSLRFFLKK